MKLLAIVLVLAFASPAAACPKTSTSDVADEVMCLQCGVPLNVAEDAPSAKRERAFIQGLVDQCRSKGQIKTALVAQFGDKVLADPKSKATWLVPALGFAAAAIGVAFGAFRWRRRRERTGSPDAPVDDSRLQADMDRYDL
ncbi:MAG: cytochrome c-type biosis protein CcmH [Thermoleophilaceae bacterium]|jgi:cytochrome c-type biogenesis protein CcmH/NrfF|nr:cytochrome c-type biosis protein CcmH [Thermoleophilaceae bacterium]